MRKLLAIEDRIFTAKRTRIYGIGIVAVLSIILIRAVSDSKPPGIDFCWIWFSGKFAAGPHPSGIYDRFVYETAYNNYFHLGECRLLLKKYDYPPTFLFLTWFLGTMPFAVAFAVWIGATLLLYLLAVWFVLPLWPALVLALAPFAAFFNILIGHNGFLTAGLIGLSLAVLERRPGAAGTLLGLLTLKPQFGVMVPLALLASRHWRAFGFAAATGFGLAAAAALAFGPGTWPAFAAALVDRNAGLSPEPGLELLLDSVYGLLHWAGAAAWLAGAAQLVVAASLAPTVWSVWSKPVRYPLKAAILLIASLLATPYVLPYDFSILSIAVAFLVKDGLTLGFLAGERSLMVLGFVVLYVPGAPLGAVVAASLLLLTLRRIGATVSAPVTVRGNPAAGARPSPSPLR